MADLISFALILYSTYLGIKYLYNIFKPKAVGESACSHCELAKVCRTGCNIK